MRRPLALVVALVPGCYMSYEIGDRIERPEIVAVAAGDDHTCVIDEEDRLFCWGFAQSGQIGEGSGDPSRCDRVVTEGPVVPRPVEIELGVTRVAGGEGSTCALLVGGGLACWGTACQGQLAGGDTNGRATPARSPSAAAERFVELASGSSHVCAIDLDARAWCWGWNAYGQLGRGTSSPLAEPGAALPVRIESISEVRGIALGTAHTCAITGDTASCWGANGAGQLGDGTRTVRSRPAPVRGLPGAVQELAAGDRHTCARTRLEGRDEVWCWGWNERGQLGDGSTCAPDDEACLYRTEPTRVALDGDAVALAVGALFGCAVLEGGAARCWGANDVGQLGTGDRRSAASPVPVVGLDDARAIATGANHTCALRDDGTLACWGRNALAQLGDGTLVDHDAPVVVALDPRRPDRD
jgi:alpha-tubulin suppressor-like RCC1 family protein